MQQPFSIEVVKYLSKYLTFPSRTLIAARSLQLGEPQKVSVGNEKLFMLAASLSATRMLSTTVVVIVSHRRIAGPATAKVTKLQFSRKLWADCVGSYKPGAQPTTTLGCACFCSFTIAFLWKLCF